VLSGGGRWCFEGVNALGEPQRADGGSQLHVPSALETWPQQSFIEWIKSG